MALDSLNNSQAAGRPLGPAGQPPGPVRAPAPPPAASQDRFVASSPPPGSQGWDLSAFQPPARGARLPQAEADARARDIFQISVPETKAEAKQLGEFFARYPSTSARQVVFLHSYWAQNETFRRIPLQALIYHSVLPMDAAGNPRTALWQDYTRAVVTGMPRQAIETAYMRAHIQDFKDLIRRPEFKQMYALAEPGYQKVVYAYIETLEKLEDDLNKGADPNKVARSLFPETMAFMVRRSGAAGFVMTKEGLKTLLDPRQPLTRQDWGALWDIGTNMFLGRKVKEPAPSRAIADLSAGEARELGELTGIPFRAGRQELTPDLLQGAAVAEPQRRQDPQAAAPRYPLRLEDFTAKQGVHKGQPMAGADGVMSGPELLGVVRNVQARVRSQLVEDFFHKYPVPEAGILIYSANMLAMNGAYGQSPMFGALANGIMPVDNDGKSKNALWQAYADAYDKHRAEGSPSMRVLESLWFKAHMHDFQIVDTPEFHKLLEEFWAQAATDQDLAPMATYTQAMVGGRVEFEKATTDHVSQESAFFQGLKHFAGTVLKSGSFPFWQQDLAESARLLTDKQFRNQPELDERGLPTDKTLLARSIEGIRMMAGLYRVGGQGMAETIWHRTARRPVETLVDIGEVLTPEQLQHVDPQILDFYRDPTRFDIRARADMPGASQVLLGDIGGFLMCQGQIPGHKPGVADYPVEVETYKDAQGHGHWDRYVVVDGERRPLFNAVFEVEGRQVKEMFSVHGKQIPLYFNVVPYANGLQLRLDKQKTSRLVRCSDITFTTVKQGNHLVTTGEYKDKTGLITGQIELRLTPRA